MKNEKKLHGFSYSKNMANFEAFWYTFSLSTNSQIVRSVLRSVENSHFLYVNNVLLSYRWCDPFCTENKLDQIRRWIVFRCVLCVKSWTVQVGDRWHRTCFDIQRANKHIVKHCKHWVVFFKSNSFHCWTVKGRCFNVF